MKTNIGGKMAEISAIESFGNELRAVEKLNKVSGKKAIDITLNGVERDDVPNGSELEFFGEMPENI